jgi:hypothetical protein
MAQMDPDRPRLPDVFAGVTMGEVRRSVKVYRELENLTANRPESR